MRVDSRFLLWGAFGQLGKGFGIRIVLHSSKTHTHMDRVLLIKTPPPQKSEIIHYTKAVPRNTWPKCHDLTRHQARFPLSPSERFESKTWAVNLQKARSRGREEGSRGKAIMTQCACWTPGSRLRQRLVPTQGQHHKRRQGQAGVQAPEKSARSGREGGPETRTEAAQVE